MEGGIRNKNITGYIKLLIHFSYSNIKIQAFPYLFERYNLEDYREDNNRTQLSPCTLEGREISIIGRTLKSIKIT